MLTPEKKSLVVEVSLVTAVLLIVAHVLFTSGSAVFIGNWLPFVVAVLFMYGAVAVLWYRKRKIDFLDANKNAYVRSIITFAIFSLIIFPPFFGLAHAWQVFVYGREGFKLADFPGFWNMLAFQVVLVALPEEFYFRGYFQSAMNILFEKKWKFLGVYLGWGWIVTALVFAFAHSIVYFKWWHFSIFFPALAFGYLRERTGTITASVLFHAACNIFMYWFVRCYF